MVVLVSVVAVGFYLFLGQSNNFQNKVDEIYNMNVYNRLGERIGIIRSEFHWEEWPAKAQEVVDSSNEKSSGYLKYVTVDTGDWTSFRSQILAQKNGILSNIEFDSEARIIWFDCLVFIPPTSTSGYFVTYYIEINES